MPDTPIQPPFLKIGDTVAIVAPAGIIKPKRAKVISNAEKLLKSWGLHVWVGRHVLAQNGHFAGTDQQRCEDFQYAMNTPAIKAIWCARGGYGSVRILDMLDYTQFLKHPKWIIGYSDITAFHCKMNTLGVATMHALMATSLEGTTNDITESLTTFKKALFGEELTYTIPPSEYNIPGDITGELVGGNLTLLSNMLGSDTSINTNGKILFFEEIGEYAYVIDRMLQSLKRAGYFENCKGIIVGDISKVKYNTTYFGKNVYELILDVVREYHIPVLFDFPSGHEPDNRAIIFGKKIALHIADDKCTVEF
ncbi:peptidase S66 [Neptunitalea chrysea]|uniref:Peptidase S66 n=2 Tax=Neptunitalea chrysea TaxID=1647581 RepID=A0A9W6B333_9FLAO|nr:peptidase S66 [Neptunitalea chrysea]